MRRYPLLVLVLLLLSFHSPAQHQRTNDSLLAELNKTKKDTNRAIILSLLCRNNLDIDNNAMSVYATQLLEISEQLNFQTGRCDAYNFLGVVEDEKSNFSKALELYDSSLSIAIKYKLDKKAAGIQNNIGLIYWKIGDHEKALKLYFDALKVFEKLDAKKQQGNVLSNIGLIYSDIGDDKKAVAFQRRALTKRLEINDNYGTATTYNNLSKAFSHTGSEDSSVHYAFLAIEIQEKINDVYGLAISYANLGLSYMNAKKFNEADHYLQKSIAIRDTIDDKLGLIFSYRAIGNLYRLQKKYDKSLYYLEAAIRIAREIGAKERVGSFSKSLAYTYSEMGNYKKAYEYMDIHAGFLHDLNDTIQVKLAAELGVKYEVEKKDLLLEKRRIELANKTLALKQRNTQLILLGILLLATGLVSYLIYHRYRMRQNIRLQKEIIKQQDLAAKAVIEAEEAERKRIASDLHDGVGQLCSAIKMNLSGLSSQINFTDKETALFYEKTLAISDEACREVRSISHQMMPNILLKSGLANAVRSFLDKIDSPRLQVRLDIFGLKERLESNIETVLYRIIQETVNNVIKHAKANELYITLDRDTDGISATIEDNGIGFDVNDKENFNGIGLKNISSRVEFLKGKVEFDSAPGRGTVVNIWIPT